MEKKRVEALIKLMEAGWVRRADLDWDGTQPWSVSAEREWHRRPFRAMIAEESNSDFGLTPATILDSESPGQFDVSNQEHFERKAQEYSRILRPLLREDLVIYFIDPYAEPHKKPFRQVIYSLAQDATENNSRKVKFVIQCSTSKQDNLGKSEVFREKLEEMAQNLPSSCTITYERLSERPKGDQFHNRYVMTTAGGIHFGNSFQHRHAPETDLATVLTADLYRKVQSQFLCHEAFDVRETLTVSGRA
jgi:hypothetical protein